MKITRVAFCLAILAACSAALADTPPPSLDDLQRQIDEGKAAQAAKAAKAKRHSPTPATATAATPSAASGPKGKLVIETDTPCELRINGERKLTLDPGAASVVVVDAGEQLIECISTRNPNWKVRQVKTVEVGKQAVLALTLLPPERFAEGSGVVLDTKTGLEWAQSDNGSDIDWNGAMAYCNKGGGWRLPTPDELQAIHDTSLSVPCGTHDGQAFTCYTSPKFNLTMTWFWSNQQNGSSQAWLVDLSFGLRDAFPVEYRILFRALCVRRP